jgi:hypothetical protein
MQVLCHNRATMDVFISWSGERSRAAAEALRGWLPKIINAIKPWLSSADIDKGARWSTDVATRLEIAKAGIICLTPNNLHSDWILFEAGALSKTLQNTFVCPFLIGMEPADVKGPLAQFQATRATKEDLIQLLRTLNAALGDGALPDSHIEEAFEVWWPKLKAQLDKLPSDGASGRPSRNERDLLEEILDLVRNQNRNLGSTAELLSFTEADRKEIIQGRIERTIDSIDSISSISTTTRGKELHMSLTGKKKTYSVIMPLDINLDEVGAKTLAQTQGPNTQTGQPDK